MQGIKCGSSANQSKLSGLAIKLKNYMLDPRSAVDSEQDIKEYFCYWKAKDFLEAEPDIAEGNTPFTREMVEEECKRRGFRTERKFINVDEQGNILSYDLYVYPFSLGEVHVRTTGFIKGTGNLEFYYYGNSNYMPVPENAPLNAVFDIMERLDAHLKECMATEWLEIEKRAAKLVKKAQLKDIADKVSGQVEKKATERSELLEGTFGKAGLKYSIDDRELCVYMKTYHTITFRLTKNTDDVNIMQMLDIAVQVNRLIRKYDAMFSGPRVAINHMCDGAMMEGWSDIRMRLPYGLSLSFEIDNSQIITQMQEANALATEFITLINQLHEKYGDLAKKAKFFSYSEVAYSQRHYLQNKDKFK